MSEFNHEHSDQRLIGSILISRKEPDDWREIKRRKEEAQTRWKEFQESHLFTYCGRCTKLSKMRI
jgi:hypothetical protein